MNEPMSRKAAMDAMYGAETAPGQTEREVQHFFAAGVYVRRSVVPKGAIVRMHVHSYDHLSVVCTGKGELATDEGTRSVHAGEVIEVKAGLRHCYRAVEDTVWLCVHGTTEEEAKKLYGGSL